MYTNVLKLLFLVLLGFQGVKSEESSLSSLLLRNENLTTVLYERVKQQTEFMQHVASEKLHGMEVALLSFQADHSTCIQNALQSTKKYVTDSYKSLTSHFAQYSHDWSKILQYLIEVEQKVINEMARVAQNGVEFCQNTWNDVWRDPDGAVLSSETPEAHAIIPPKTVLAAFYFNLDVTAQIKKHMVNGTFRLPESQDCNRLFTNPLKGEYKPIIVVWVSETGCVQSRAFKQDVVDQQGGFMLWN